MRRQVHHRAAELFSKEQEVFVLKGVYSETINETTTIEAEHVVAWKLYRGIFDSAPIDRYSPNRGAFRCGFHCGDLHGSCIFYRFC